MFFECESKQNNNQSFLLFEMQMTEQISTESVTAQNTKQEDESDIKYEPIEKSPGDANSYQLFTLENGLQVLLAQDNNQVEAGSDSEAIAYVSLSVNVGSFNDPPNRQGMAHFLEHMIFMGSEKYKQEEAYSNHISESGGYCNATTNLEDTAHYFDISYSGLKQALDMMANNLHEPRLNPDAIEREINAIESEFKMITQDDYGRILRVFMSTSKDKDHIFNRFMWGNKKSLLKDGRDKLWDDLKQFFQKQYSPDRMKLVIQVKTNDDMVELKKWVIESFRIIQNKDLGRQDYSKIDGTGSSTSQAAGSLPYAGVEGEMAVLNSIANMNILSMCWCLPSDFKRFEKKSLDLIHSLINHKGEGSLYQCLKGLNYIVSIDLELNSSAVDTPFKFITVQAKLSENGVTNYKKVIALILEFFKTVKERWLADGKTIDIFNECQTISKLSYDIYSVPDGETQVQNLSREMIHNQGFQSQFKLLEQVYNEPIIEKVDLVDIKDILGQFTIEKCKVILLGNDLLKEDKSKVKLPEAISEVKTEEWFGITYQLFKRPDAADLKASFEGSEWKESISMFKKLEKNKFVPTDVSIVAKNRKIENDDPELIHPDLNYAYPTEESKINSNMLGRYRLYHLTDHVYLKPKTFIDIILRIRNPLEKKSFKYKKPLSYLETAKDFALFNVMRYCFRQKVTKQVGYYAQLAHVTFELRSVEEMAVNLRITGFSDQIFEFAKTYIELLFESANQNGFEAETVNNSIESVREQFANSNNEVDAKASHNRILMLIPHLFHDKLIEKELTKQLEKQDDFNPGLFLKNKILTNISSVEVLVFGNTRKEDSVKFFQEHIIQKFTTVPCLHDDPEEKCSISAGCIYLENKMPNKAKSMIRASSFEQKYMLQRQKTSLQYKAGYLGQITWDCPAVDVDEELEDSSDDENLILEKIESMGLGDEIISHKKQLERQQSLREKLTSNVCSIPEENDKGSENEEQKEETKENTAEQESSKNEMANDMATEDQTDAAEEHKYESSEEESEKDDEEEGGDEEDGEEEEENNFIELYFQPKYQYPMDHSFKISNMLDVLSVFIDEKMYDELRTQQQLGYYVGCYKKCTCGIFGLSFVLQSAEFPPQQLEERIIAFIDDFYYKWLDESNADIFEKYKKGTLNRLRNPPSNPREAAEGLYSKLIFFCQDVKEIQWDLQKRFIKNIEEEVTLEKAREFYKLLFAVPEKIKQPEKTKLLPKAQNHRQSICAQPDTRKSEILKHKPIQKTQTMPYCTSSTDLSEFNQEEHQSAFEKHRQEFIARMMGNEKSVTLFNTSLVDDWKNKMKKEWTGYKDSTVKRHHSVHISHSSKNLVAKTALEEQSSKLMFQIGYAVYLKLLKEGSISSSTMTEDDLQTCRNHHQKDARNYVAIRVFSPLHEKYIVHKSLDKQARRGKRQLIGQTYTTFMPQITNCGEDTFFLDLNGPGTKPAVQSKPKENTFKKKHKISINVKKAEETPSKKQANSEVKLPVNSPELKISPKKQVRRGTIQVSNFQKEMIKTPDKKQLLDLLQRKK